MGVPRRRMDRMTAPDMAQSAEIDRTNGLLLRVAREHDRQAFVELFHHFAPRLKSFLLKGGADAGMAEEIVQDVMVTVWRRAGSFDPALSAAGTWIFTIARNRRIDRLRQERRPEIDPDDPALVPAPVNAADEGMMIEEQSVRLHRAIRELPAEQAELLKMAYFQDKAHSAIFDNSKIKQVVPEFVCTTPFARGAEEIAAWFLADPSRQKVDPRFDALWDRILANVQTSWPK